MLIQAIQLHAQGHASAALGLLIPLLKRETDNLDAHHLAALCAIESDEETLAEVLWQRIIQLAPADGQTSHAHFNLGLFYATQGQAAAAELHYRQAHQLDPHNADSLLNLGHLLAGQGLWQQAEELYRQAVRIAPDKDSGWGNLANLLTEHGPAANYPEAETCYLTALRLAPEDGDYWTGLGVLLGKLQRGEDAEKCHIKAISLQVNSPHAYANLGVLLTEQERYAEAEQCLRHALKLSPGHAHAWTNLGLLLEQLRREPEAITCHRLALTHAPNNAAIHANLGNALMATEAFSAAEEAYRCAIQLAPSSAIAHANLGVLLAALARDTEAENSLRQALCLKPDYPLAKLNLSYVLLKQGRFAEGWPLHESRYSPALPGNGIPLPDIDCPQWQGEALEGKSLLVWGEQGFGDQLQFCRYLPLLKAQGVRQLSLTCRPGLRGLLSSLEGVDSVTTPDDPAATQLATYDYWLPLLSLPFMLATRQESLPASIPYLTAKPERVQAWQVKLPARQNVQTLRIGLAWCGNPLHHNDKHRSLPDVALLAPLWSLPNTQFISLQKGPREHEITEKSTLVSNLGANIHSFDDTAAIVSQLDLVICVDTSIAHLAGALGIPCWLLLPTYRSDWRWGKTATTSAWYPQNMRLFRQTERGEWSAVIAAVQQALADLLAQHPSQPRF